MQFPAEAKSKLFVMPSGDAQSCFVNLFFGKNVPLLHQAKLIGNILHVIVPCH